MRFLALLILFLPLLPAGSFARVSMADGGTGLPDKFITSICRDVHGLMWIGTKQGVCNYDGSRFEPMQGELKSDASVSKLIYDASRDRLWAATAKGLFRIQCGPQTAAQVTDDKPWSRKAVADIFLAKDGTLYASYLDGEIARVTENGEFALLTKLPAAGSRQPFANRIESDRQGILLFQLNGKSEWNALHLKDRRIESSISDGKALSFKKQFADTTVTVGAIGGMSILKADQPLFPNSQRLLSAIENLVDVQFTSAGSGYVVCKQARIYHIDFVAGTADTISSDLLKEKLATCVFLDKDQILWVGTNKGLLKIASDKKLFTSMLVQTPPLSVRSLAEDDLGNVYAGTYSGLFRYSAKEKQWTKLHTEIFYAMINVPGPYLYLITEHLRLFRMHKKSLRIEWDFAQKNIAPEREKIGSNVLVWTPDNTIWIGTSTGLATYNISTNLLSFARVKGLPENTRIVSISPAQDGQLWLSSRSGVFRFDPEDGIVFSLTANSNPALPFSSVNYTFEGSDGQLWLCTQSGGLNRISADRKTIRILKTESGLSDNETYQLIAGNERIWISTFNGLSSYNLVDSTFCNYYVEDGLPSDEFNHNAFLRTSSGRIFFGGINGIASFDPDSIPRTHAASRLFVSSITKWDNRQQAFVHLSPVDSAASIDLKPLDHSLTFNLALDDYQNPEAQIFQYRIKGLFNDWVTLNKQHTLRLDGLAPGTYELEIKAIDRRGAPTLNTLHYNIRVEQLFYRTAWFYLLLFVVASGLLWAFFYLRLQHVKRVQKIRERLASDLHDEVGSLLTRITMTSDNLQYSRNSEQERSGKLQKIASLSRNAASSMSDILWAIDARNDYTGNLADRMREHAEEMLAAIDVQPDFEFAVNQKMSIPSELRQQLYLLYKEAINNIVKHSRASEVRIIYMHNEQGFELSIHNDGILEKERPSNGQGLKNIRMRAGRLHAQADIRIEGDTFAVLVSAAKR